MGVNVSQEQNPDSMLSKLKKRHFPRKNRDRVQSENTGFNKDEIKKYLNENPDVLDSILQDGGRPRRLGDESTPQQSGMLQVPAKVSRTRSKTLGAQEASCTFLSLKSKVSSIVPVKIKGAAHLLFSNKYTGICLKSQTQLNLLEGRKNDVSEILDEAACILAKSTDADGFALYIPQHNETELEYYYDGRKTPYGAICKGSTVAATAALDKKNILVENLPQDSRYPKGVGRGETTVHCALCIPLVLPSNDLLGVIELTKEGMKESFTDQDVQLANAMLSWLVSSVHQCKMNRILMTQSKLNDFLLDTTKVLFDDMISIDALIQNIMFYTKDLVRADRCALFLVDEEKKELFADYFDEGIVEDGRPVFTKKSQIRFPADRGIAGHVAKTGEVLNIPEAYADSRFNRDIDKQTGYKTKNILCMPISSKGKVIGVVQLINCLSDDHFTKADEEAFKMFAVYCALALHYSKLYSLLKQQQSQYKVAMDVLEFHFVAHDEEVKQLLNKPFPDEEEIPSLLYTYDFYAEHHERKLPHLFLHMLDDLFGQTVFDINKLCRFILTVKKNYRPVLYHNWKHGFHVAHSLYCMIKASPNIFSQKEAMGLVIAGVCHDLDHRGYNNAFFTKLQLPMAALYSTSVMEQHHYKMTVMILQSEGHDIFSFMTAEEYKDMLEVIRKAILATDLALYFPNQKNLSQLVKENKFSLDNEKMRDQCKSLMMTGADLCAVTKPWATQEKTVECIYEEFYFQGDEEKKRGYEPIPMMDRDRKDEIPKQQVGFFQFICQPLYTTLSQILPGTHPLLDGTNSNLSSWQQMVADGERKKKEEQEEKEEQK